MSQKVKQEKFRCPQVFAHRGASHYAPENTPAAFELAAQQGAKWLEVDLQLTHDGNIAIIHNSTVTKRTDGRGKVLDMDYETIAQLDAGSWFGSEFVGQRVLSLEKLIILLDKLNINANLEIKANIRTFAKTAEVTAKILQQHWPQHKPWPLISSFSIDALKVIQDLTPHLPRGFLINNWNEAIEKIALDLDCVSINVSRKIITPQLVNIIHDMGRQVTVYTINNLKKAVELITMGVDGLFTNRPGDVIKILQQNKLYRADS